jgi:hypothetical protein
LGTTDNVDLHQAYFEIRGAIKDCLRIKAGRFELNYGNQRVFGSVGWSNTGRSWEGGLLSCKSDKGRFDFFTLKRIERNDEDYNRDFDIYGLYAMCPKINFDLFAFYEVDSDSNDYVQEKLKRYNIGFYHNCEHGNFDGTVQGVHQFGERPFDILPSRTIQDISAFMFAAEAGYNFEGRGKVRLAAGIDYTSGDDGTDPGEYNAYTNAYFTGHKFMGYMDYFTDSPSHGLVDIMLRGKAVPARRWLAKADIHFFRAAEDYQSKSDDGMTDKIGMEFDLTVINKSISGANLAAGASFFLADENFSASGDERKTGIWTYLMTTINF